MFLKGILVSISSIPVPSVSCLWKWVQSEHCVQYTKLPIHRIYALKRSPCFRSAHPKLLHEKNFRGIWLQFPPPPHPIISPFPRIMFWPACLLWGGRAELCRFQNLLLKLLKKHDRNFFESGHWKHEKKFFYKVSLSQQLILMLPLTEIVGFHTKNFCNHWLSKGCNFYCHPLMEPGNNVTEERFIRKGKEKKTVSTTHTYMYILYIYTGNSERESAEKCRRNFTLCAVYLVSVCHPAFNQYA